jgi:hypothetical protein
MLFFNIKVRHHASTMRRKHSWRGSFWAMDRPGGGGGVHKAGSGCLNKDIGLFILHRRHENLKISQWNAARYFIFLFLLYKLAYVRQTTQKYAVFPVVSPFQQAGEVSVTLRRPRDTRWLENATCPVPKINRISTLVSSQEQNQLTVILKG